jgi:precorrin-6B methylase 2
MTLLGPDLKRETSPAPGEVLRAYVAHRSAALAELTALSLALRAHAEGEALPHDLGDAAAEVLAAGGAADAVGSADPAARASILALLRAELLFAQQMLTGPIAAPGWQDRSPDLLQAFGSVSSGFPALIERLVGPELPSLLARLAAPGGRFLDIGTGVAALSIAMLRHWPELRATGIEPLRGAIELARKNLGLAGLAARMELRQGFGEDLAERAAYDLTFVPGAFIRGDALPLLLARAHAALKPGGWLLLAVIEPGADPAAAALARFRAEAWGGKAWGAEGGQRLLEGAGFETIRVFRQQSGFIAFLAAEARVGGSAYSSTPSG